MLMANGYSLQKFGINDRSYYVGVALVCDPLPQLCHYRLPSYIRPILLYTGAFGPHADEMLAIVFIQIGKIAAPKGCAARIVKLL